MSSFDEYSRFRLHRSDQFKSLRRMLARRILLMLDAGSKRMSIPVAQKIGGGLGSLIYRLAKRERQIAKFQLGFCFPEKNKSQIDKLVKECFRHFSTSVMEFLVIHRFRENPKKWIRYKNAEILQKHFEEKNGCILLASHFGNWELLSSVMEDLKIPTFAGVKRYEDPVIQQMILERRQNEYLKVILRDSPSTAKFLIECIKKRNFFTLAVDIDTDLESVYADFFGYPCKTPVVAAKLCLKYDFPAVMAYDFRQKDGSHEFRFREIYNPKQGTKEQENVETLTAKFNAELEIIIRERPESWVWFHRRWRNQKSQDSPASKQKEDFS